MTLFGKIRRHLDAGGVIAYPTESCYGLGCIPENRDAVRALLKLKKRRKSRGLILIAGRMREIRRYMKHLPEKEALNKFWPGPNTLLLPASRHVPVWIRGNHEKVALRITAHRDAARLCNALSTALVSTSANVTGTKPAKSYRECTSRFGRQVLVVPGKIGKRRHPSTIMDFETGKIFRP
ncbi:MAG TPA: L-threonylcarbamoyladenylate synthase [Burkholderiales bacterium]|nr:L-threonylcarbamoyladenylate synthase [Burkholderiales bacterium]